LARKKRKKFLATPKGKKYKAAKNRRNLDTPQGKAAHNRRSAARRARCPQECALASKLSSLCSGHQLSSKTIWQKTAFQSRKELLEHLESTFAGGMSFDNYGSGADKWNIGHRIAAAMYNHSNADDVYGCYSKPNLFAQWQPENFHAKVTLPEPSKLAELVASNVEPASWEGRVPTIEERHVLERAAWGKG